MATAATTLSDSLKSSFKDFLTQLGAGEVSKEYFDLIKNISEAKSKQEEVLIIEKQAKRLQHQIKNNEVKIEGESKQVRELLIRLIYCEMMGHQVPFGYMEVLKLTQVRGRLQEKKIGYICATLFLHPEHSMATLCINSFKRDFDNQNPNEIDMALTAMCYLLNKEAIPAVLTDVLKVMGHSEAAVRKKAVIVIKRILQIDISYLRDVNQALRRALCDVDPAVMATTLNVYEWLAGRDPIPQKDLIQSLVSIQKQVIEHALSREYDYHRVPAPWIQVRILKILSKLGTADKVASENMYEVIGESMRRASGLSNNAGNMVLFECINTIAKIHPNSPLLNSAADATGKFLTSADNNLKYLGLKSLKQIVDIGPAYISYALKHQLEVIGCLTDPDETIQRKTLELLYTMTNAQNVTVITEKLLDQLKKTTDQFLRTDLVNKITEVADKFAPDNEWYIKTMNKVFLLGVNLVSPKIGYNLLALIAEGSNQGEDEEADNELRALAVDTAFSNIEKNVTLSNVLTQVTAWVLGEYSYIVDRQHEAIDAMCDLLERQHDDEYSRVWVLNSLSKLVAQTQTYPSHVAELVEKYKHSSNVELQQRAYELDMLSTDIPSLTRFFPQNSFCDDLRPTNDLSFLNQWVKYQVQAGNVPSTTYKKQSESVFAQARKNIKLQESQTLKYSAYKAPDGVTSAVTTPNVVSMGKSIYSDVTPVSVPKPTTEVKSLSNISTVTGPWGNQGWESASKIKETAVSPKPSPTPTSAPTPAPTTPATSGNSIYKPVQQQPVSAPAPDKWSTLGKPATPVAEKNVDKPAPPSEEQLLADQIFQPSKANNRGRGTRGKPTGRTGTKGGRNTVASPVKRTPSQPAESNQSHSLYNPEPEKSQPGSLFQPSPSTVSQKPPENLMSAPIQNSSVVSLLDMSNPQPLGMPSFVSPSNQTKSTGGANFVYQVVPGQKFELANLQQTGPIAQYISGRKLSHPTTQPVYENSNLRIAYIKAYEENKTTLAIFTSNKTNNDIHDINHAVTAPTSLNFTQIPDSNHSVEGNKYRIKSLPSGATAILLFSMAPVNFEYNIPCVILSSYVLDNNTQHARFTVQLSPLDFIRNVSMDINSYGSMWGTHPKEMKQTLPHSTIYTAEQFTSILTDSGNFHVVSVKGLEIVACSQTIISNEKVFLHAKITKHQLIITLRSKNQQITDAIGTAIKHLFSGK